LLPNPKQIPNFITAASPLGLRRAMLKTNSRLGSFVRYFDITNTVINGRPTWVAWFYEDIDFKDELFKDSDGGKINGNAV
jgi:hypothetical protein